MSNALVVWVAGIFGATSFSAFGQTVENFVTVPQIAGELGTPNSTVTAGQDQASAEPTDENDGWSNASTEMREHRSFALTAMGGIALNLGFNTGAHVAYNLEPALQLGFGTSYVSHDYKKDAGMEKYVLTNLDEANMSILLAVVDSRFFMGNSFNVGVGMGMRWVNYNFKASSKRTNNSTSHTGKINSIVVGGSLGNQWVLDNGIVLGCDWISFYQPLASSLKTNTSAIGPSEPELKTLSDDLTNTGEKIGKIGAPIVLGFHIGFMF